MKTLQNAKLIRKRIESLTAPKSPLKGANHKRDGLSEFPLVFERLEKIAPSHCQRITERGVTNRFGKIGFYTVEYVSPELYQVVQANLLDFQQLEKALETIKNFNL